MPGEQNLYSWPCPIELCNKSYGTRAHWARHFKKSHPNNNIHEFKAKDEAINLAKLMAEGIRISEEISKARKPTFYGRRRKAVASSACSDSPTVTTTPATPATPTSTTTTSQRPGTYRGPNEQQSSPAVLTPARPNPRKAILHYGQPPRERYGTRYNPAQFYSGNLSNTAPAAGFGPNLTVPGQPQNATDYEHGAGQFMNLAHGSQRSSHVGVLPQVQTATSYYAQGGMDPQAIGQGHSLHDISYDTYAPFHDGSFVNTSFDDTSFRGPGSRGPSSQGPLLQPASSRGHSFRGHAETFATGQGQSHEGVSFQRRAAWGQATGQGRFLQQPFSHNSSIQAHSGNQSPGQGPSFQDPFFSGYSIQSNTVDNNFTINGFSPAPAPGLNDADDLYSLQE